MAMQTLFDEDLPDSEKPNDDELSKLELIVYGIYDQCRKVFIDQKTSLTMVVGKKAEKKPKQRFIWNIGDRINIEFFTRFQTKYFRRIVTERQIIGGDSKALNALKFAMLQQMSLSFYPPEHIVAVEGAMALRDKFHPQNTNKPTVRRVLDVLVAVNSVRLVRNPDVKRVFGYEPQQLLRDWIESHSAMRDKFVYSILHHYLVPDMVKPNWAFSGGFKGTVEKLLSREDMCTIWLEEFYELFITFLLYFPNLSDDEVY